VKSPNLRDKPIILVIDAGEPEKTMATDCVANAPPSEVYIIFSKNPCSTKKKFRKDNILLLKFFSFHGRFDGRLNFHTNSMQEIK